MVVVCVVPAAASVATVVFIAQISIATDFVLTVIDFTVTAAMGLVTVNRGSAAPGIGAVTLWVDTVVGTTNMVRGIILMSAAAARVARR